MMLQQDTPQDFVIATGVQYSVRQFIEKAAAQLGITVEFTGQGEQEQAVVTAITGANAPALKVGDVSVTIDPRYYRPTEVETLLGDPSKAKTELGWVPEITLDDMVAEMAAHDLQKAKQHALLKQNGYTVSVSVE
jgi:GDPmannose 4,6-dehydratase